MDISSLLSPQDSPVRETPPATSPSQNARPSPNKRPQGLSKRKSSGLSQSITPSPRPSDLVSLAAHNASYQAQQQQQQYHASQQLSPFSPGINATPQGLQQYNSATSTPSSEVRTPLGSITDGYMGAPLQRSPLQRQGSTPGMDALADLASMQQSQANRRSVAELHRTPSREYTIDDVKNLPRPSLSARSSNDVTMADAQKSPRIYIAASLSDEDCQSITELASHLNDKPDDFQSHIRFINLLHKGFTNHVRTQDSNVENQTAQTYELLADLRKARETMDARYPVGEGLWVDWLDDEKLQANSTDDRLSLMELFKRALTDEPSSSTLWQLFGEYMYYLWATAYDVNESESPSWSDEDKLIGKEVFKWEPMMNIWEQGIAATQWRMNDSNTVWDRCTEIMLQDQEKWPSPEKVRNLKDRFMDRLTKPHATWDQTSQNFSTFLSTYDRDAWEETMVATNKKAAPAKQQFRLREVFENKIEGAIRASDKDAEWTAYMEYLDWENRMKGVFSDHLIIALYERAIIRFPTDASLWEDYVEFLINNPNANAPVLSVLERATRHCPWSGNLWTHRLITLEGEGKNFREMEDIKHLATRTGLLEENGMEELLKVYMAWCGFLRRRAFAPNATEDDIDVAEVGIRSALEDVREIGEKKYGKEFKGDPQYRIERIHIKLFSQSGNVTAARQIWEQLAKNQMQADSYDFWYRYYIWEMVFSRFAIPQTEEPDSTLNRKPELATEVLREGLKRVETMDWPEQLIQMYLNHCEQHENVQNVLRAIIQARNASRLVAKRREKEAADAAAAQQQYYAQNATSAEQEEYPGGGKRKRGEEAADDETAMKKSKSEGAFQDASASATSQTKRDRENTTILVRGIPAETTETRVRQFFTDCGTILSLNVVEENGSKVAAIEFDAPESADFARTKAVKPLDGHTITVDAGSRTTLWVSNYPPIADESYIRDLFKEYEVVEVRFPSLKFNTHRRFCYVQCLTSIDAHAATRLDGKELRHKGEKYKLVAKISDPTSKTDREGAVYEGREIYVHNLHFDVIEAELHALFKKYGDVERVRIPRNVGGRSKGFGFVVYKNKEDVEQAIIALESHPLRQRPLRLEISKSQPKGSRRTATLIRAGTSASPSLEQSDATSQDANAMEMDTRNGKQPAHSPPAQSPSDSTKDSDTTTIFERTIALLNVPDTVSAPRIEALVERYGAVKKIKLRLDHGGAMVEFADVVATGRASLGLEGKEIDGQKIRVGSVNELKKAAPVVKHDRLTDRPKKEKPSGGAGGAAGKPGLMAPAILSRPKQPGTGRRGGGLGFKRGGAAVGGGKAADDDGKAKSNSEFRDMFLKGQDK